MNPYDHVITRDNHYQINQFNFSVVYVVLDDNFKLVVIASKNLFQV